MEEVPTTSNVRSRTDKETLGLIIVVVVNVVLIRCMARSPFNETKTIYKRRKGKVGGRTICVIC